MTEKTQDVIKARNVGVAFVNHDKDDIKSKVFRLFTGKKKIKKVKKHGHWRILPSMAMKVKF